MSERHEHSTRLAPVARELVRVAQELAVCRERSAELEAALREIEERDPRPDEPLSLVIVEFREIARAVL